MSNNAPNMASILGCITAICGPNWVADMERMADPNGYDVKTAEGDIIHVSPMDLNEPDGIKKDT